jgi:hypothetical protein
MRFQLKNRCVLDRLFKRSKGKLQEGSNLQSLNTKPEVLPVVRTNTVLSRIISDEAIIVRLIKQDILTSIILRNSNRSNLTFDLDNKFELNNIIYDLLLLDKAKNKDEIIEFYDKMVEDSSKMLLEFPKMSLEELALNCYLEVRRIRMW